MAAWEQACAMEEQLLQTLEERRLACEERLAIRKQEQEEEYARRRPESQANFQRRQVVIHAKTTDWVNQKLEDHQKFEDRVKANRAQYRQNMRERSKSCSDIAKKALDKVNQGKAKLREIEQNRNEDLMRKHVQADERREMLNQMKFKNENDIYSFREMKHHSFGELNKRRQEELKKRKDAEHQASIIRLAERHVAGQAQSYSQANLRKCRQDINKESLTLADKAAEGFLKIQSEPDQSKVVAKMNEMGFDMPKLPEKDEEAGEEETKAAF